MNICFCINDGYVDILKVCMYSILVNNTKSIYFYIFSSFLSEESKNKLNQLQEKFDNCKIRYEIIDNDVFKQFKLNLEYISIETYFRYIIADILSEEEKALYIDADTIINGNLEKLYNTDLEGYYCAGVKDLYIETKQTKLINILNLKAGNIYVNAGVLLLNLKLMRDDNISQTFIDKTIELKNIIEYQDQDIINVVLAGKIKPIDSIYNFANTNMHKEWKKCRQAVIIHYTGHKKPWLPKCHSKLKNVWRKYYLLSIGHKNLYQKYLQSLCEKIFSVKNNKWTHKTITVLGIKLSLPKMKIFKKRKENPYYYCKKHNIDITKVPKATGHIRNVQLANLALLLELDYVCKKNNLKYWLDGGTLLGAIRHKGYIPWDDDIDTAMMREDYEKVVDAFNLSSKNPDIFAGYYRNPIYPSQCFIKVQHRKCSYLFVDIFPWDYYGKKLTTEEQLKISNEIKELVVNLDKKTNIMISDSEIKQINHNIMHEKVLIIKDVEKEKKGDFVWGIDYHHVWNNWFTKYDVVYPFKTIEFEGYKFPCINNPDAFLTRLYGNYMEYPKNISCGHNMYKDLNENEQKIVESLIYENLTSDVV